MRSPVFKFFSSLKLAVFSILQLAAVLAAATIAESFYGMRAAHVMIYGTWWFAGVLFLLGLNVLCAALSRYPWKKHQTGFVITHTGILTLLLGSFITQQFGVDGNLPITENTDSAQVQMNDLVLLITDEAGNPKQQIPIPESAKAADGRLLEIALGKDERIVVDRFMPRVVAESRVVSSSSGIGVPAIKVELYNDRFQVEEWLFNSNPDKATELNLGPATLTFQKLWGSSEEKRFFSAESSEKKKTKTTGTLGYILFNQHGKEFRVVFDGKTKAWKKVEGSNLRVRIDRYLPFAVVEGTTLTSRSAEAVNPALQLTLGGPDGVVEQHTLFARFPEFNTLHEKSRDGSKPKIDVKLIYVSNANGDKNESLAGVGNRRGKLTFGIRADGTVLYKVFTAKGDTTGSGEVVVGKEIPTGWMDLKFKVTQAFGHSVQEAKPRYVEYIEGGGDNFLTGVRYHRETGKDRTTAAEAKARYLVEGGSDSFLVNNEKLVLHLTKTRLALPFSLFLSKFTIGNDPGTTKAATYESQVMVKDPAHNNSAQALISMNEPLKYGGYTFYQASYQMEEGRPPVSIFSVNYDPGRMVKYAGALFMVIGALLMFYMNPHYWNKLLGGKNG